METNVRSAKGMAKLEEEIALSKVKEKATKRAREFKDNLERDWKRIRRDNNLWLLHSSCKFSRTSTLFCPPGQVARREGGASRPASQRPARTSSNAPTGPPGEPGSLGSLG